LGIFDQFSTAEWAALAACATAVSTVALVVGLWIAIGNLRAIVRSHNLEAVTHFYGLLASVADDRRFLTQDIDILDPASTLSPEQDKRVRNVLNFHNKIGMLMDMKLLPQKFVLSLTHTMIIRDCYLLIPYAVAEEKRIGGRYGRRLLPLLRQAQMYHDASPNHRITRIKISKKGLRNGEVIYETRRLKGFAGVCQRTFWSLQRSLRRYYAPRDLIPESVAQRIIALWPATAQRFTHQIRKRSDQVDRSAG
jgi:hypothetical protein